MHTLCFLLNTHLFFTYPCYSFRLTSVHNHNYMEIICVFYCGVLCAQSAARWRCDTPADGAAAPPTATTTNPPPPLHPPQQLSNPTPETSGPDKPGNEAFPAALPVCLSAYPAELRDPAEDPSSPPRTNALHPRGTSTASHRRRGSPVNHFSSGS